MLIHYFVVAVVVATVMDDPDDFSIVPPDEVYHSHTEFVECPCYLRLVLLFVDGMIQNRPRRNGPIKMQ